MLLRENRIPNPVFPEVRMDAQVYLVAMSKTTPSPVLSRAMSMPTVAWVVSASVLCSKGPKVNPSPVLSWLRRTPICMSFSPSKRNPSPPWSWLVILS